MKKIDFAQLITILANVGVVIGLVFLALEIRQNTAQMRTQGAYSIIQSVETLNQAIYSDAEFADLHFGYVDLKIRHFRTIPGRQEFVEAYIEPSTFLGREDIQKMLVEE